MIGQLQEDGHARLKAFIVQLPGQAVDQLEVLRYVKDLEILDQLPRTENGKIQRYKLREQM